MPTLFVNCRSCGRDFPTPIGEPAKGPSGVIISGLKLRCPQCRSEQAYSTADFHVPVVADAPPEGGRGKATEDLTTERKAKKKAAQARYSGAGVVAPDSRPRTGG